MGPCVRRDDVRRVLFGLLGLIVAWSVGSPSAEAHPHVWITARSEVVYAPDGSMTGVRHAWTFDDMFTTYALQGLATKTKGVYTREELAPLAQTNVELLKEFNFFTFAKADGKKAKFVGAGGLLPRIQGQRADAAFRAAAEDAGDAEAVRAGSVRPLLFHRLQVRRQGSDQAGRRAGRLQDAVPAAE